MNRALVIVVIVIIVVAAGIGYWFLVKQPSKTPSSTTNSSITNTANTNAAAIDTNDHLDEALQELDLVEE